MYLYEIQKQTNKTSGWTPMDSINHQKSVFDLFHACFHLNNMFDITDKEVSNTLHQPILTQLHV